MNTQEKIELLESILKQLEDISIDNDEIAFVFHTTWPVEETRQGDCCSVGITKGKEAELVNSFIMHYNPDTCDNGTLISVLKSFDLLCQYLDFREDVIRLLRLEICVKFGLQIFFDFHKRVKRDGTILN